VFFLFRLLAFCNHLYPYLVFLLHCLPDLQLLVPEPAPPLVHIERVQVAGNDVALPALGGDDVVGGAFASSDDNVRIDYVAPCFRGERDLRYQYRLEGADSGWSDPTPERSVNYAQIPPGDYRFLVRAVHAAGAASAHPATFSFRISPPYWRTWWFIAGAIVALAAAALSLHRMRVRQIVALETIRRQIATDIHDDMGAGLSQIAILSEVAKREAAVPSRAHLDEVASLARSMRDSMGDIVWAVDPRRDRASDLVQRMRQVAFNLFEAEGVKVELNAPPQAAMESIDLAPDRRRHLLMMFKEAVSNVARHARAREVRIEVALSAS
jgi:signal transduction histidine kinase